MRPLHTSTLLPATLRVLMSRDISEFLRFAATITPAAELCKHDSATERESKLQTIVLRDIVSAPKPSPPALLLAARAATTGLCIAFQIEPWLSGERG